MTQRAVEPGTPEHKAWLAEMHRRQDAYKASQDKWSKDIQRPAMKGR